jgi:excisionase family DNA binding protein
MPDGLEQRARRTEKQGRLRSWAQPEGAKPLLRVRFMTARPVGERPNSSNSIASISHSAFSASLCHTYLKEDILMSQTHIDPVVPSDQDAMLAKSARIALEGSGALDSALHIQINAAGRETTSLDLPPVVTRLLMDILKQTAAGKAVSLLPIDAEVTTQQAARILNVSRPYLIGMVNKGIFPTRMVGNQRRLPLRDVLAYKTENRAQRRAVLAELVALDQELGLE